MDSLLHRCRSFVIVLRLPALPALATIGTTLMTRTATARWTFVCVALLAAWHPARSRGDGFELNVRPLLQKHCLRCHGEQKPKGDINLAKFEEEDTLRGDPELWVKVVDALTER